MNNRKKKILIVVLSIFLFLFLATLFINIYMVSNTKSKIVNIDNISEISDIDAILILGCRVNGDTPSLMLTKRLEKGIEVYNKIHTNIVISGSKKDDYDEVSVMNKYLISSNIDSNSIYLDYDGHTTYDSIYRIKEIYGAKKIVIITQEYHLYRALYISNNLDIEAIGIAADNIPQKFVMLKNQIREIFSRDKNFFKVIFKPKSNYSGKISLNNEL